MILRARVVVPVSRPPIPNGAVEIRGNRVVGVGPWRDFSPGRRAVIDLGETALLPGLVNAHCHLDYTALAGEFPPPKVFSDWLKLITTAKAAWTLSDYLQSWRTGAGMLVRNGTTTVGDIEALPDLLPQAWRDTPLRMLSFLEMIGITGRRSSQAILGEAVDRIASLKHPRNRAGLSPHAPYSTLPELLRLTAAAARRRRWRVAIHISESALEYEMFTERAGSMFDWIERSGRDMSDCGGGTPVQHVSRCGLAGARTIAVHLNYLGPGDTDLIARSGMHVAHCPRSHRYFGHDPFPLRRLLKAGVNVCLATDSLASVYKGRGEPIELSLFDEMRELASAHPGQRAADILRLVTLNGAHALGMRGQAGELTKGAFADLITLPFVGNSRRIHDHILEHRGPVAASLIDGHWAIPAPAA